MAVFLSTIIPTYNRLDQLKNVLAGIEKQTVSADRFEVVIVSDGSQDGTDEYLLGLKTPLNLALVSQANQGVAAARNAGLARARGEIVLFLDDDVVPAPDLMAQHIAWHEKFGENVVVIGPMLTPNDHKMSPWVRWEQDHLARQYNDMLNGKWEPTARQFYTGNTSLRRCHLNASGGFDPSFRRAEDVELAYRLSNIGLRFMFNPQAVGYHYAQRSYTSWLGVSYAYGRNDVIFTQRKGQTWLLPKIYEEFYTRHPLTRLMVRLFLGRQPVMAWLLRYFYYQMDFSAKLNLNKLADLACSASFNLNYYQGIVDELGSREAFFAGINQKK